jgi:hypothetical protein
MVVKKFDFVLIEISPYYCIHDVRAATGPLHFVSAGSKREKII